MGSTPRDLQRNNIGVYLKRTELVNGRPTYMKAGDPTRMMWHSGTSWMSGHAASLGTTKGFIHSRDGALTPDAATSTWRVSGQDDWVDAPEVRCLAGEALEAELAKAAPRIALVGPTPDEFTDSMLGLFEKRAELVNGYPSYTKSGDPETMMWHAAQCWYVGVAGELGEAMGHVSVDDNALAPEAVTSTWYTYQDKWVGAPEVRCLPERIESSRIWSYKEERWLDESELAVFRA